MPAFGSGRDRPAWRRFLPDLVYATFVTGVGLAVVLLTPVVTNDASALIRLDSVALYPSFYPRAVGYLIISIGSWLLLRTAVKSRLAAYDVANQSFHAEPGQDAAPGVPPVPATWRTAVFPLSMLLYAVAVTTLGFRTATLVFGIAVARWLGSRWGTALAIGMGLVVALSLLFVGLLGVNLPSRFW